MKTFVKVVVVGPTTFVVENETAFEILRLAAEAHAMGDMVRYLELRDTASRIELGALSVKAWEESFRSLTATATATPPPSIDLADDFHCPA